jgi:hypothetical protein
MNRRRSLYKRALMASTALLLVGYLAIFGRTLEVPASQVSGTNYTSPNYGYTITWQLPWYVVEDEVDASGFDLLRIADSRSEALFAGGYLGIGNPTSALQQLVQQMEANPDYANVRSVDDPQCSSVEAVANIAAACYRADVTYSDGSQGAIGIFFKAWIFEDGVTLWLRATTEEPILVGYIPHWKNFGVYEKGTVPDDLINGCAAEFRNGVEYCFDPALSERDRSDMVEGVRLGQNAIAEVLGDQPVGSIHVTGLSSVSPEGDELIATTYGDAIAVYAGSTLWQGLPPILRIESIVHEYFHVFQNSMTNSSQAAVPLWFLEGSAEAFGFAVASQIGVTDGEEFYSLAVFALTQDRVTGSLRDLGLTGSLSPNEYPLAYLAVQYLLGNQSKSVEALVKFYQELGNGSSFETAFVSVFGTTLDQFYGAFELWRVVGMPDADSLDDDFYPNSPDETINRGTFSWTAYPQGVHHGRQLLFVAQTKPLVDCTLYVNLKGQLTQRATWANGQGEIFWLVSLPHDAGAGIGYVTVDCGGILKSSVIGIA